MWVKNATAKDDIKKRLSRIEGQVRGVARMVDDDRDCHEIIQQLAAIRSAVQQTGLVVVRAYAAQCLLEPHEGENPEALVEDLISVLSKVG